MKRANLFKLSLLFLFMVGFIACSDEEKKYEIVSLRLEVSSCEVMLDQTISLGLTANEDVTLTIHNPDVVDATYNGRNSGKTKSMISIVGKQKGSTSITITDNQTKETAELFVRVTDKYLSYVIDESTHLDLKNGMTVFLVNNDTRDCYFARTDKITHTTSVFAKGTYQFSVEKEGEFKVPYLTLIYGFKSGDITEDMPQTSPHKFNIKESSNSVFGCIQHYLDIDWEQVDMTARTDAMVPLNLNMKEVVGDHMYIVEGNLQLVKMPEGMMTEDFYSLRKRTTD